MRKEIAGNHEAKLPQLYELTPKQREPSAKKQTNKKPKADENEIVSEMYDRRIAIAISRKQKKEIERAYPITALVALVAPSARALYPTIWTCSANHRRLCIMECGGRERCVRFETSPKALRKVVCESAIVYPLFTPRRAYARFH